MKEPAILLVTCCLEETRRQLTQQVFENIRVSCPADWLTRITVFDNASTFLNVDDIKGTFKNVYRSDRNVGYWTAIDWWLSHIESTQPKYTYIIESDMLHYDAAALDSCVKFLDDHPDIGSIRLHEYSIKDWRLYNKDVPRSDSRRNLWQSHTNKVTGESVVHEHVEGLFWKTNFLTQLPSLNRYATMKLCFDQLRMLQRFSEVDFQRFYHDNHSKIAIIDGGIFNCDLNPYGTSGITGSWTNLDVLNRLGYQSTRSASIVPRDQYTVTIV